MKVAILAALALLLPGISFTAAADHSYTIKVGSLIRSYIVHTPPASGTAAPMATVILLHPYLATGAGFVGYSGLPTVADARGFAVVAPNTVGGILGTWNSGGEGPQNIDDVAFLRAMIGALVAQGISDPTRVYLAGMSDGGFMAYRGGCELSDLVAAIGVVAATETQLNYKDTPPQPVYSCNLSHPVPVLHIHGLADNCVPFDGGGGSGLNSVQRQSVPETIANWQARDNCAAGTTTTTGPGGLLCGQNACASGSAVQLCTIAGAGHIWPGASYFPAVVNARCGGTGSSAIDAASAIWSFVSQYSLVNSALSANP